MVLNNVDNGNVEETRKVCNLRERPLLIRLNGTLYDIALFASKHPGGQKVSSFVFLFYHGVVLWHYESFRELDWFNFTEYSVHWCYMILSDVPLQKVI